MATQPPYTAGCHYPPHAPSELVPQTANARFTYALSIPLTEHGRVPELHLERDRWLVPAPRLALFRLAIAINDPT